MTFEKIFNSFLISSGILFLFLYQLLCSMSTGNILYYLKVEGSSSLKDFEKYTPKIFDWVEHASLLCMLPIVAFYPFLLLLRSYNFLIVIYWLLSIKRLTLPSLKNRTCILLPILNLLLLYLKLNIIFFWFCTVDYWRTDESNVSCLWSCNVRMLLLLNE